MKKIVVIGNVGREPQTRTAKNGKTFSEFSLAVNDLNGTTLWLSVIINHETKVLEFIKKGKQLYIEGNFSLDVFKDQPCITVYANEVQLLGQKSDLDVVDRKPDVY